MSRALANAVAEAEAIEAQACLDLYAAAPSSLARSEGLAARCFGSLAAFAIRGLPATAFNRVQRLGTDGPTAHELGSALAWMREKASAKWAFQAPEGQGPEEGRDLSPTDSWTKFARATDTLPEAASALDVHVVGTDRGDQFGRVVQTAFGLPPSFAEWLAHLPGRPGWTTYLAVRDATPAAAAALYVSGRSGWLGLGCCLPEFRRQGAQSTLFARRIADAARAGVPCVITETGTPPPGRLAEHPSYRNILRAGFQPLYRRTNWRPAGHVAGPAEPQPLDSRPQPA